MKGYIPVEIPTRSYIKAYIIFTLGEQPVMSKDHLIGHKLIDLLGRKCNEDKKKFAESFYNARIKVYISKHIFRQSGSYLHETNIRDFNSFIWNYVKDRMRFLLDHYIQRMGMKQVDAIYKVQEEMGFTMDDLDFETIQKDYLRYRHKQGIPLIRPRNKEILKKPLPPLSFSDFGPENLNFL